MTVTEAAEVTIQTALERGMVDQKLHAVAIEAIRKLAHDADERPELNSVTYPTLLKFLGSMGIIDIPTRGKSAKKTADDGASDAGRMDGMRGRLYGKLKAV